MYEYTLRGTDNMSMLNMNQRTRLFAGTKEDCEARLEYFKARPYLGYTNLKVS